jgi:glycosyltransferase involved in cell wall biosynthesis
MPRGQGLLRLIGRALERVALRRVDAVILASRFFETKYRSIPKRLIFENYPDFDDVRSDTHWYSGMPFPRISYIGKVRHPTTLRPLLRACAKHGVEVHIHGDGLAFACLKQEFESARTVIFFGRYHYTEIPKLYEAADIIWAAYPISENNARYAISNKYHECLLFRKPGVFSKGTAVGCEVEADGIGYLLDATNEGEVNDWLLSTIDDPSKYLHYRENICRISAGLSGKLTWRDNENHLSRFVQEVLASERRDPRRFSWLS